MIREQQVYGQGGIYLDKHGIFRGADKSFDTQVLFDFTEKQLDFPAVFINVGNGFSRETEIVGQKLVVLPNI